MNETLEMLMPAVDQQLSSHETPYVAEAYQRLLTEPEIDEMEARKIIPESCIASKCICPPHAYCIRNVL